MALQKSLVAMGVNSGTADGIFGTKTEAAVKQVLGGVGITADGISGPSPQAAFDELKAKMSAAAVDAERAAPGINDMLQAGRDAAADAAPDIPDLARGLVPTHTVTYRKRGLATVVPVCCPLGVQTSDHFA